jgi:hypothetical protein
MVRAAVNAPPAEGEARGSWREASFEDADAAAEYLARSADAAETYCALGWSVGGKRAEHVVARRWLSADIDDKAMPGATAEERHRNARNLVGTIPCSRVTVDSGNGFHVHVPLPERDRVESFEDAEDGRRRVVLLGRALRLHLEAEGHDLFGMPVALDHCHGAERVWRVPPGVNAKSPTAAKVLTADSATWRPVRLAFPPSPDRIASLPSAQLSFLVPFMSAAEGEEDGDRATLATEAQRGADSDFDVALLPEQWRARWPHDGGDPSRIDYAIARALFEVGHGEAVVREALRARRALLSDPEDRAKGAREDYLARTLAKAKAASRGAPTGSPRPPSARTPFPLDALPPTLRGYIHEAAAAVGCDPSVVALPLLASIAGAVGNTRRVRLKRGWTEPAVLWGAIVGESGTLKSPALDAALAPVRRREAKAARTHADLLKRYATEMDRYARDRAHWLKKKGDGEPPAKPERPALPRHLVSDTTVEALAVLLQENPRGLLLARDELSGWLRSFDAYRSGNRGGDVARWLEMHRAGLLIVDRKTGEPRTIRVPRAAVSIAGTIQPDALRRSLGAEHFEDGLAARFLLTMPPPPSRRWTEAEVSASAVAAVERVFDGLLDLRADVDPDGEPVPRDLALSAEAKAAWVAFVNAHGSEGEGLTGATAAAWSKAEGCAARLALVVHLARWAAADAPLVMPDVVDEESVASGVALARWFMGEAERVYGILRESVVDADRRRLAEWIGTRGGRVTVRDLTRGPRAYRDDEGRAERALGDLVAARWGTWEKVVPTAAGGRPTRAFVLCCGLGDDRVAQPVTPRQEGVSSPSPPEGDPTEAAERAAIQDEESSSQPGEAAVA